MIFTVLAHGRVERHVKPCPFPANLRSRSTDNVVYSREVGVAEGGGPEVTQLLVTAVSAMGQGCLDQV